MRRLFFSTLIVMAALAALGVAGAASAQCGTCVEEQDVSGDWHWFQNPNPQGMSDPHGSPVEGTCNSEHEWCVAPEIVADVPDADAVLRLVVIEDTEAIKDLLSAQPMYARVNRERRALQLLACGGDVMVHIPLSDAFLKSVAP